MNPEVITTPAITGLILMLIILVLYATEVIPLAVTAVIGSPLLIWFQACTWAKCNSGYNSDSTWMVFSMCMVGACVFECGLAETIGNALKNVCDSEFKICLYMFPVVMIMSAFLNNSATTSTFKPILESISKASNGKISARKYLMPLAFAASAGGMLTLAGSTPQVIINGLFDTTPELAEAGYMPFSFFEFALVGGPVCIILLIGVLTFMGKMAEKFFAADIAEERRISQEFCAAENAAAGEGKAEVKMDAKQKKCAFCMAFAIVGFIVQGYVANFFKFSLSTAAITAAMLTVILGCWSLKALYIESDWNTFFVLAGSISFASGLSNCGTGTLIAEWAQAMLGDASAFAFYAVFVVIAIIITQIMSNTAAVAMMGPIAINVALGMGFSPMPILMGLAVGCTAAFMTPVGTPPNTIVLSGGYVPDRPYRFMDYVKLGGIFQVIATIAVVVLCPIFYPL
jgi:anion transporter